MQHRAATVSVWNNQISVSVYNSLLYANLHDYIASGTGRERFASLGPSQSASWIACNLPGLNEIVNNWKKGGTEKKKCVCTRDDCCNLSESECNGFFSSSLVKRTAAKEYPWEKVNPATGVTVNLDWWASSVSPTLPSPRLALCR